MNEAFLKDYKLAYGEAGMSLLAYWMGSFFAHEIKQKTAGWPFLALNGNPETGKSSAINTLSILSGGCGEIDTSKMRYEGIVKYIEASDQAPMVMIFEMMSRRRSFEIESLKDLYNFSEYRDGINYSYFKESIRVRTGIVFVNVKKTI